MSIQLTNYIYVYKKHCNLFKHIYQYKELITVQPSFSITQMSVCRFRNTLIVLFIMSYIRLNEKVYPDPALIQIE